MPHQVVGRFGNAVRGQVIRSRTYQPPDRTQALRVQAAVRQLADTKRNVHLVIQEMRDPVGEESGRSYVRAEHLSS